MGVIVLERHGYTYKMSGHAIDRWKERFSGINRYIEFRGAQRVGKKTIKLIKELSPVNSKKYLDGKYKGRYCLLGRSNIVFVISGSDDVIVTVFHLYGDENQ